MIDKGGAQRCGESCCPRGALRQVSVSRHAARRTLNYPHLSNIYRRPRLSLAFQG